MADTHTTADKLQCIVVTPEATELETPADFVALPLYDGEVGIAPGRAPLIGRLGYGELRVRYKDELIRYYVDGGFVQVADNVVSVLTNRAILASVLDRTTPTNNSAPPSPVRRQVPKNWLFANVSFCKRAASSASPPTSAP